MSFNVTNCITKTLSLTDANITFTGEIIEESVNNLKTLIYEAILTYDSSSCPVCGNLDSSKIIKHGSKKSIVRILPVNGQPAAIRLKNKDFYVKNVTLLSLQKQILLTSIAQSRTDLKHIY